MTSGSSKNDESCINLSLNSVKFAKILKSQDKFVAIVEDKYLLFSNLQSGKLLQKDKGASTPFTPINTQKKGISTKLNQS